MNIPNEIERFHKIVGEDLPPEIQCLILGAYLRKLSFEEFLVWVDSSSDYDLQRFKIQWGQVLEEKLNYDNVAKHWRVFVNESPKLYEQVKTMSVSYRNEEERLFVAFAKVLRPREITVKVNSLERLCQPDCHGLFTTVTELTVDGFSSSSYNTLKIICEEHDFILKLANTGFLDRKLLEDPKSAIVFERTIWLETRVMERGETRKMEIGEVRRLCHQYPDLRLGLWPDQDFDLKSLLNEENAVVLGALNMLRILYSVTTELVAILDRSCTENSSVRLQFDSSYRDLILLDKSPVILERSDSVNVHTVSLFTNETVASFLKIRKRFPKLRYQVVIDYSLLEGLLDDTSMLLISYESPTTSMMYCEPSDCGVQIMSEKAEMINKTLQLGIGGCALGLHPKTVKQLKTAPYAETLCVKWLGPLEPTTGFATSLAEKVSENLKHLEKVIMQNFPGDLDMVQKALEAKNVHVPVTLA